MLFVDLVHDNVKVFARQSVLQGFDYNCIKVIFLNELCIAVLLADSVPTLIVFACFAYSSKVSQFLEFCNKQKIIDIYDLILIPYYSKSLLREFGAECMQAVINSIIAFIDLQTFEYTNISFDDLE